MKTKKSKPKKLRNVEALKAITERKGGKHKKKRSKDSWENYSKE